MNKPNGPSPICCGQDSRWVDNGPRWQYYYCDECKDEVPHDDPLNVGLGISDYEDFEDFFNRLSKTTLEDPPTDKNKTSSAHWLTKEMIKGACQDLEVGAIKPGTEVRPVNHKLKYIVKIDNHDPTVPIGIIMPMHDEFDIPEGWGLWDHKSLSEAKAIPGTEHFNSTKIPSSIIVEPGSYWLWWVDNKIMVSQRKGDHDIGSGDWVKVCDSGYFVGRDIDEVSFISDTISSLQLPIVEIGTAAKLAIPKKEDKHMRGVAYEDLKRGDSVYIDPITGSVRKVHGAN